MGRKSTQWTFQEIIKRNITWEKLGMAMEGKPNERNQISPESSTKQCHKDYVKIKIDKTQQNRSCSLGCDKCRKLVQREYKTRHDWTGKVIHWELCKMFKFDHKKQMIYLQSRIHTGKLYVQLLCFDLLTRPKMPFKVMHRKEVTHSGGSYERKSRGRKLADEMGRGKKDPIILS